MSARKLPSQEYLRQCFEYDPATGELFWKERPREHFKKGQAWGAWNTKTAGKIAGCDNGYGYLVVGLGGVNWFCHRVIWKLLFDQEPDEIDHKNLRRNDNRLDNLRAASHAENKHNTLSRPSVKNRVSPLKGVSRNWKKWCARIKANGEVYCLGTYDTQEEAHAAYRGASLVLHGKFANR